MQPESVKTIQTAVNDMDCTGLDSTFGSAHLVPPLSTAMSIPVGKPAHCSNAHSLMERHLLRHHKQVTGVCKLRAGTLAGNRRTLLAVTCLVGASRRHVATTPPSPTAAKRSPLGAKRTAVALPQLASLQQWPKAG